jgi:ubiquinone/menaquinone biosynthesis C-methylase UbiE
VLPDLRRRTLEPELIDLSPPSGDQLERMHRELGRINGLLGGVATSLAAIGPRLRGRRGVTLADVGSGGADLPRALDRWCRRRGLTLRVVCVDSAGESCRDARRRLRGGPEALIVQGDGLHLPLPDRSVDIAHAALVLHHFAAADAAVLVREMRRVARDAVVINDLHRHPVAYAGIRVLTALCSRSPFIRHDGPLSVRRGFHREELAAIVHEAGGRAAIRWRWAFRYACVVTESVDLDERR